MTPVANSMAGDTTGATCTHTRRKGAGAWSRFLATFFSWQFLSNYNTAAAAVWCGTLFNSFLSCLIKLHYLAYSSLSTYLVREKVKVVPFVMSKHRCLYHHYLLATIFIYIFILG